MRVPSAASLDVGDSFTLEGWIKRGSTANSENLLNRGDRGFQLTVMNAGAGGQGLAAQGERLDDRALDGWRAGRRCR